MFGYRSESAYGEGYHDAKSVIAHEIFELGNTDILRYVAENLLFKNVKLKKLADTIESGDEYETERILGFPGSEEDWVQKNILTPINRFTGLDIRYVLWLCDNVQDVEDSYGCGGEVDVYKVGEIILSDLGHEGKLYGYEKMPRIAEQIEMSKNKEIV